MDAEADVEADPINPMLLFHELSARLPRDAIITADSGSSANWYARQLKFRGEMRGSLSGNLATMGPGVPYGIGAKFGHPGRPVIVFAGDGAMQMNGLAELITIKHYWQQWADPRLIIAVLAQQRPQPGHLGDARDGRGTEVHRVAAAARRLLRGLRRQPRPARHRGRQARAGRGRPGTGRWPPTARPCSTSGPTPTCPRSRRTPPSSRPRMPPRRC